MDVTRQPFPCLVHQPPALVEDATAGFVDHDAVWIDQHNRGGILAARVDWFAMHAVPIARLVGTELERHSDAVTSIETRTGRNQRHGFAAVAEIRTNHRGIALEAATR